MKIHRFSGLVLAVFCCMTLVVAAAGSTMVPEQGPDQGRGMDNFPGQGSGQGFDMLNVTEHGQSPVHGNSTNPPRSMYGAAKVNMTALNGTIIGPYPRDGQRQGSENMSGFQGNFTSSPPMLENLTWPGNIGDGNLTSPWLGADHRALPLSVSGQKYDMNQALEQGKLQDNDEIIEAFLAWLRSYLSVSE